MKIICIAFVIALAFAQATTPAGNGAATTGTAATAGSRVVKEGLKPEGYSYTRPATGSATARPATTTTARTAPTTTTRSNGWALTDIDNDGDLEWVRPAVTAAPARVAAPAHHVAPRPAPVHTAPVHTAPVHAAPVH